MEIERKFLPSGDNWEEILTSQYSGILLSRANIEQYYFKTENDKLSLRVRKTNDAHELTLKCSVSSEASVEITKEKLTAADFEVLKNNSSGKIVKTRKNWLVLNYIFEIDVFEKPDNLTIIEIEFKSLSSCENFNPGLFSFLGKEVTGEKEYSNKFLSFK